MDNWSLHGKPLKVNSLTESLITRESDSQEWYDFHTQYDRFSVKVSTIAKPKYSQIYTFVTNLANCEIWVDDKLVVAYGQLTG